MKDNKLTIRIKRSVSEVFIPILDPKNTPKWVDTIVLEKTNEWPPKKGTIYKSQNPKGDWSEYVLSEFEENKMFVLSDKGSSYHVRYKFSSISLKETEIEYFEWVDNGELDVLLTKEELYKLKQVLEVDFWDQNH